MPGPDFLDLPTRTSKPRGTGITHVLDRGMPLAQAADLLATSGPYVDVWKFGWGISYLDADLAPKLELLARHRVLASPGGTLLEIAWAQGRAAEFLDWARGRAAFHRARRGGPEGPGRAADARPVGAGGIARPAGRCHRGAGGRPRQRHGRHLRRLRRGARGSGRRPGVGRRPGLPGLRGPARAPAGMVRAPVRPRREPGERAPGRCARAGDLPALAAGRHLWCLVTGFGARARDVTGR